MSDPKRAELEDGDAEATEDALERNETDRLVQGELIDAAEAVEADDTKLGPEQP